jgi:hypothetical protein
MSDIRIEWQGGPLDGCVKHFTKDPPTIWYGPDVTDPYQHVVVYKLVSLPELHYEFDQSLSDAANKKLDNEKKN